MKAIKIFFQIATTTVIILGAIYLFLILFNTQVEHLKENESWRKLDTYEIDDIEIKCVDKLSTKNYKWIRGEIDVNNTPGDQSCFSTSN